MATLAFLALVGAVVTMAMVVAVSRFWGFERAFIRLSWVPPVALLIQAVFWRPLLDKLYYGAIALPVATAVASAVLGIIGTTLTCSRVWDAQHSKRLVLATLGASVPLFLVTIYVIYAVVSAFWSR